MLINDYNIKNKYNAILNKKEISPSKTTLNVEWLKNSLNPFIVDEETKFCTVKCQFTFMAETEQEFEKRFSEFNKDTKECVLNFDNINMNYNCCINNVDAPERITPYLWEFTTEWIGYKCGNEIIETMNHETSKTIVVGGNLPTPAIVTMTVPVKIIDMTITGLGEDIIIKNLKPGREIIINGEDGTVLEAGLNKFGETDIWGFPKLQPGENVITTDKVNSNIEIKYKERWI